MATSLAEPNFEIIRKATRAAAAAVMRGEKPSAEMRALVTEEAYQQGLEAAARVLDRIHRERRFE